jgi:hypothetical protein
VRLIAPSIIALLTLSITASGQKVVTPPQTPPTPGISSQPPSPNAGEGQRPPQEQPRRAPQPSPPEQRGTEDSPLIVKALPTEKTAEERAQEKQDRDDKASADWWLVRLTGALALVGILQFLALIGQAIVFRIQAKALRESVDLTRDVAGRQERDMHASITEAGRAAGAMERIANEIAASVQTTTQMATDQRDFWQRQMRAYISITDPAFVPQNRETPYHAEVLMHMINTGHTPAHNVRFAARVRVFSFPLPQDFDFVIQPDESVASGTMNPGQRRFFRRSLDRLLTDDEIREIKTGWAQKLYIYGTLIFEDAFGIERRTDFCQFGMWDVKENFATMNTTRHNDAT